MPPSSLADFGLSAGELIDGKYRIDRLVGSGGAGMVVAAQHLGLDEPRALKLLRPEALSDTVVVARFEREARAVVKIKGDHVCAVHDVGRCPRFGPYIVMDLLEGHDLRELVEQRGPLPIAQAVGYLLEALEALAQAHAIGIVHRDLKPGNLFAARGSDRGVVLKVLDFGISKLVGDATRPGEPALTKPTMIMGSLPYVSPEQAKDPTDVDPRADIWGIGTVLYELLTGARAFPGSTPSAVLLQVMTAEPVPIRQLRSDVPSGLDTVIGRCLAKDRAERYPTVGDLALALGAYVPGSTALVGRITRLSLPMAPAEAASQTIALPPGAGVPPSGTVLLEDSSTTQDYQAPRPLGSAPTLFQPPTPSRPGDGAPGSAGVAATPHRASSGMPLPARVEGAVPAYGGPMGAGPAPPSTALPLPPASASARAPRSGGAGVAAGVLGALVLLGAIGWMALRTTDAREESSDDAASIADRGSSPNAASDAAPPSSSGRATAAPDAGAPAPPSLVEASGTADGVIGAAAGTSSRGPAAPLPPAPSSKGKNPLNEW